ncbi:unnamed protein product [Rotaria magnacalcarata]|uniref:G-protein coupled receptors family 1 profile domain-containing protein n=1 Tax=Rotaria magnacalcarata TaxID=392030 RepID=A0A816BLY2_9BILA|nr:unnamed protein product [Rotaria magnacalcarata]
MITLLHIIQQYTIYVGCFLFITGLAGNIIHIYILSVVSSYRSNPCTFYFLIASICDILILSVALLSRILETGFKVDLFCSSIIWCKFRAYFIYSVTIMPFYCQCLATVDQYFVTSKNIELRRFSTMRQAYWNSLLLIVICLLHGIPFFLYSDISPTTHICALMNIRLTLYLPIFILVFVTLIPSSLTIVFGFLTYRNVSQSVGLTHQHADRQLVNMLCMQIILILITTIPYGFLHLYSLETSKIIKSKHATCSIPESFMFTIINLNTYIYTGGNFFVFMISSSRYREMIVSISSEEKCSTDDDCDLELLCNTKTNTCACFEPYFWREDVRACFGCSPGWLKLNANKCLLYAISQSPGVTWYEVETMCQSRIGQPMMISNIEEFTALQQQVEYLLNEHDELAATLYFHQGAWVQINDEWSEFYTWCSHDEIHESSDCIQIRQDVQTNIICLQYVPCINQSQYICEASSIVQSELAKRIADGESLDSKEETMLRAITTKHTTPRTTIKATIKTTIKTTVKATVKTTTRTTTRTTLKLTTRTTVKTTKKNSSTNMANALSNGINAAGQNSNLLGGLVGEKELILIIRYKSLYFYLAGNTNQNQNQINNALTDGEEPNGSQEELALSAQNEGASNKSWNNILLYGGIGLGIIVPIVIIIVVIYYLKRNSTNANNTKNINSTESFISVASEE